MLTFTIWLLITTSPAGDVFVDSYYDTLERCIEAAADNQECVEGMVLRPKEQHDDQ